METGVFRGIPRTLVWVVWGHHPENCFGPHSSNTCKCGKIPFLTSCIVLGQISWIIL